MIKTSILTILVLLGQVIFPQSAAALPTQSNLVVTPESIDFGGVPVGTYSLPQTATITNDGDQDACIDCLEIVGPDADQFFIASVSSTDSTLAPDEAADVDIVFYPDSTGDKTAYLRIYSGDPEETTILVPLTGQGICDPSFQPDITVVPLSVDFGSIEVGDTSLPVRVTVSNEGNADLVLNGVDITGPDASQFFITSVESPSPIIPPGTSASGTVAFQPASSGDKTAYLRFFSNDPDESCVSVDLSGSGVVEPLVPDITVDPMSVNFDNVPIGSTSAAENVTVTNEGNADLVIGNLTIDNSRFAISTGNISFQTLVPGTSANISLIFSPVTIGAQSANLTVPSNDPDENPVIVALSGTGTEIPPKQPDISVDPMSVNFGTIAVGTDSASQNVTISNIGTGDLIIGNLTIDNNQFAISSGNISLQTLIPGASANVTLIFSPAVPGEQSANLTIPSNDPDENPVIVALSGTGTEIPPKQPDISVDPMSVNFGTIAVGTDSASQNVTISNVGTGDLIIGNLTIDNNQFAISSGNISLQTLIPGASANISLVCTPTAEGAQSANLTIPSNDPDEAEIMVPLKGNGLILITDLAITKSDSPDPVIYGENITYTLTVTNNGPDDATGVIATDTLPAYVSFISASTLTGTASHSSGTVTWDIGDLASGASATLEIVVTLNPAGLIAGGPLTNNAQVVGNGTDPDPTNNSANEDTAILSTDLRVTKTDFPDPVALWENFTWVVTVTNNGPEDAVDAVVIDLYSTPDTAIHQITPSEGSVSQTPPSWLIDFDQQTGLPITSPPAGMSALYWEIGDLASGASANLTIIASANFTLPFPQYRLPLLALTGLGQLPAFILPNATLVLNKLADTDFTNNSAYITTTSGTTFPEADLSVTKTDSPDPVIPGDDVTYTVTIYNSGPDDAADVFVLDTWMESQFTVKSAVPSDGTAGTTLPSWLADIVGTPADTGYLYWDLGDLAGGATATLTIVATVNATIPLSMQVINAATVSGPVVDKNPTNNYAGEYTDIARADLAITKSDSPDPVAAGGELTYVLTVSNLGPDNATGVNVTDTLPAGTIYQSATPSIGSYSYASGNVTWDIGDLGSGVSANLTIIVTAPEVTGTITNNAKVTGNTPDPVFANNTASENTTVVAPGSADLQITKTDSPDPVATGGDLTYVLTVKNNGPANADGVSAIDKLPAGVVYQSATTLTGSASYASGNVTWDIGKLASGTSANLTILVTAPATPGLIINNAGVTALSPDPITANNNASESTWVALPTSAVLTITKSDSPDPVATGGDLTYIVTVKNHGPADASGTSVIDELPDSVAFQSAATLTGSASYASGNVTWDIGSLASGTSANLTILVTAPSTPGKIYNLATVDADNRDPIFLNSAIESTTVVDMPTTTDLQIVKTDSPDPVIAGNNLTYTLTVTNNGPASASGVRVIDNLPDSVILQSATTLTGATGYASGNVTWDIGSLASGASANLTVIVATSTSGTITNTATVSGNEIDLMPLNNVASASTTVLPAGNWPDITVKPMSIDFGSVQIYTPSASQNVTVSNDGTADLIIGTITIDNPRFAVTGGDISGGKLVPGASANISINFSPTVSGAQSANLIIPSNDPDESAVTVRLRGNGTAPDITVVPLSIDFRQVRRGASSPAKKVTVTNDGTAPLIIGNLAINNRRFTISSGNITGQIMPPGASAEIMLIFKPTATGAQAAVLSIPSNDPDESVVNVTLSGTGTSSPGPGPGPGPNPPEPTPTPTPTPTTTGGTGPQLYFTIDFLGKITQELADSLGRPVKNMAAPSPDDIHKVEIEAGTRASDNAGLMVTLIEIRETPAPPLPENTRLVGEAYEFKPSGTFFDKAIKLTLGYDVGELPDGVISVGAAYYTTTDGWVYLEPEPGGVAELGKVTAPVSHFTVFAVLAKVKAPEIVPPAEPTPEPGPQPEPAKEPALFNLGNLSISLSESRYFEKFTYVARTGEEAVFTADVTNNGGQPGSYAVVLMINGTERERKEINLQPGQTETVSFTVAGNEPGRYMVVIGNLTGDFLSELWINWWLIAGTAGALILLIWLAWYIIKRRKKRQAPT